MNLNEYLEHLEKIQKVHPVIEQMEKMGKDLNFPILNRLSARFLSIISLSIKAEYVFEIGSGFGYSAMWIAIYNEHLKKIYLTDFYPRNLETAREFFRLTGVENKVETIVGDGIDILGNMNVKFDLIFNDANKESYPRVLEVAKTKLKEGGILLSDNTLWHYKVLDNNDNETTTKSIREFNIASFKSEEFISSFIPIGDGLILSVKI